MDWAKALSSQNVDVVLKLMEKLEELPSFNRVGGRG
jgi:hypothetical protein